MGTVQTSPFVTMLRFLKRLDKCGYTPREILILTEVANRGGIDGLTVSGAVGMPPRQVAHGSINRLIRGGLIEDRREEILRGVPQRLFITKAGRSFFVNLFRDTPDASQQNAEGQGIPAGE